MSEDYPLLQSYQGRTPKKRPTLSESDLDKEIHDKYVQMKDPYAEEIGPGTGIMRDVDSFLFDKVVDPLSKAGYPKIGAGLGAAGYAVADMVVPQTAGDFAGTLIPFKGVSKGSKMTKASDEVADLGSERILKYLTDPKIGEFNLDGKGRHIPRELAEESERGLTDRLLDSTDRKDELKKHLSQETDEPYVGWDIANPAYHKIDTGSWPQPYPVDRPVDVKGHLGKSLSKGGPDPFAWMDSKYGVSKEVLKQHAGKPLKISTRSDLIAHDDYIDRIDPRFHEVEFYIPTSNSRAARALVPGSPSVRRQMEAIKKLQDKGIKVSIVHDKIDDLPPDIGGLDELLLRREFGVSAPIRVNPVTPDDRVYDVLGLPKKKRPYLQEE